ncbi:MAG: DUF5020 domain-containing protein [Bacteroidetes bacterium GWF2_42_66]|jgi:hypothetical protein|nr:MAG: DUF5020 domain-containing protein [Bacteroidetes bacterium GWA2_42_15]OFX98421.1 MAG: DUF5020 domain-containing protein [Bacteroidetes bacterium GWE2_42_39]OFY42806.1 MAG: DUF5020 domain-containing protein [Bacteroidetes bacterium GWF2_42_66]HBL74429.1 DUF5020 domain-containing protein [Prolixibacteraceae bacterium]HCR90948.1 DUF5020 domain-containing protein [Prolixibacteraceae bacterium]
MKKLFGVLFFSVLFGNTFSQNIQLHYDMGKDRGYFTSTVEMFKPDKLGNTFFFIDFDYGAGDVEGVSLGYFEIARCFKLGKSPFSWHGEYNGGLGQWKAGNLGGAYTINNAWLTGLDYSWNASDFSRGFSLKVLYKNIANTMDDKPNNFQLTGIWYLNFCKGKMSFTGFADFWKETTAFGDFVFLSEPQIWYNTSKHFAVGGEVELSNNFGGMEGFKIMPTLGAKYIF